MSWLPVVKKLDPKQRALVNFVVMQDDTGLQIESVGCVKSSEEFLRTVEENEEGL